MRIAVVDDNPVNQNSFRQKIEPYPDLDLILVSDSGDSFLEHMKGAPVNNWPEVVFMDIQMPGLNGVETIKIAKALYPSIHFIVLTVFEDNETIFEAIQSGASGYLLKQDTYHTMKEAIDEVVQYGGAPMSPAIARKALKLLTQREEQSKKENSNMLDELLSEREREILTHLVSGYDAKRIAEITNISTLTVRKHIANIYNKLHVNSKAQVISMAHKNKWFRLF